MLGRCPPPDERMARWEVGGTCPRAARRGPGKAGSRRDELQWQWRAQASRPLNSLAWWLIGHLCASGSDAVGLSRLTLGGAAQQDMPMGVQLGAVTAIAWIVARSGQENSQAVLMISSKCT